VTPTYTSVGGGCRYGRRARKRRDELRKVHEGWNMLDHSCSFVGPEVRRQVVSTQTDQELSQSWPELRNSNQRIGKLDKSLKRSIGSIEAITFGRNRGRKMNSRRADGSKKNGGEKSSVLPKSS
jgi:hypothetical protein